MKGLKALKSLKILNLHFTIHFDVNILLKSINKILNNVCNIIILNCLNIGLNLNYTTCTKL